MHAIKKSIILLLFLCFTQACAQSSIDKIGDKATFDAFSGLPLTDKYGQVTAIKVVYDLEMKQLYFLHSKDFTFHYEFCYSQLNYTLELHDFNKLNYSNHARRRFLLGNVNYFKTLDKYVLEISSVDLMNVASILELHKQISEATFFGKKLHFLLNTPRLQNEQDLFATSIAVISPVEIYATIDYQAISTYKGQGILRFINDFETEKATIKSNDIIVLRETPLYLPRVAGIISTEFQTPLSHLSILGKNRKIPIAAYKKAFDSKELRQLANKPITYVVTNDTFHVTINHKLSQINNKQKKIKLTYDLQCDSLINLNKIAKKAHTYIGHKAANFAILYELSKKGNFKTPESAFAIPFHFYNNHVLNSKAQKLIDSY